ncbi:MAG: acyl-CoA thioesterase [Rhodospirillales bacterium]|nr:acyl-CoA thioesterase [Rhodospirillales bacterium]
MSMHREDYTYFHSIPTRWNDNDMLGHVNNVIYYSYFEAIVTKFVQEEMGIDWALAPEVPYTAENLCRFKTALKFPETVEAALRVTRIGNTSFDYAIALFSAGKDQPAAEGHWVHVMVDRESEKPVPLTDDLKQVLKKHMTT